MQAHDQSACGYAIEPGSRGVSSLVQEELSVHNIDNRAFVPRWTFFGHQNTKKAGFYIIAQVFENMTGQATPWGLLM